MSRRLTRHTAAQVGGPVLAAGAVVGIVLGISLAFTGAGGSTSTAAPARPTDHLECDSEYTVGVRGTSAQDATQTTQTFPSPARQADRWAEWTKLTKYYPQAELTVLSRSPQHLKLAYVDGAGHTIAILSYTKQSSGWGLGGIDRCAFEHP